jgi:hypothetical protein
MKDDETMESRKVDWRNSHTLELGGARRIYEVLGLQARPKHWGATMDDLGANIDIVKHNVRLHVDATETHHKLSKAKRNNEHLSQPGNAYY